MDLISTVRSRAFAGALERSGPVGEATPERIRAVELHAYFGRTHAVRGVSLGVQSFQGLLAPFLVIYPLPYYLVNPFPRYKHPIEPIMLILIVYVIAEANRVRFRLRQNRV